MVLCIMLISNQFPPTAYSWFCDVVRSDRMSASTSQNVIIVFQRSRVPLQALSMFYSSKVCVEFRNYRD